MSKYNKHKVIYKLVVEDIQTVAQEILDRELTNVEIDSIIDSIAEKIPWYDAIELAIEEKIETIQINF